MHIIQYPHPTLRHKSKPLRRVDDELRGIVREMFRLMYEARGVGLAANQVDLPLRLFVVNLKADPSEGEELVFINPVISGAKGLDEAEEGCLSLPGLYGQVRRPKQVRINAYSLDGQEISADATGLFARVVQHESDHLDGTLFVDRLTETGRLAVGPALEEFELAFKSQCETGGIPTPEEQAANIAEWERKFCV